MFAMSSDKPFADNLAEMNIAPIAVSYEYEPCDVLKTQEVYLLRKNGTYTKTANEDLNSIVTGIQQFKGRISYTFCPPITETELASCQEAPHKERFRLLAEIIDRRIYSGYRLFKTNYMAYDLVEGTHRFTQFYRDEDLKEFIAYTDERTSSLEGDRDELQKIFLGIYANPVRNCIDNNI
jgi:acyltransferase family protein